jgi:hypothetical protein
VEKILPCNHFLIQLRGKKTKKQKNTLSYDFHIWRSFEFVQNDDSIEINNDLYGVCVVLNRKDTKLCCIKVKVVGPHKI